MVFVGFVAVAMDRRSWNSW